MATQVLSFEREEFGKLVQIADGLWVYASRHRAGRLKQMPVMNNRAFVSIATGKNNGNRCLVAIGLPMPDDTFITAIAKLEAETGLKLQHVISQSGIHNMFLTEYVRVFGENRQSSNNENESTSFTVHVPPARVAHVEAVKHAMESNPAQVKLLDERDPFGCIFSECAFDGVVLGGMGIHGDTPTPQNPDENSVWFFLSLMPMLANKSATPHDELFAFHRATKLALGGDNVLFYYPQHAQHVPTMMKLFGVVPGVLKFSYDTTSVLDRAKLASGWATVAAWPVEHYCGFHELPGVTASGKQFLELVREDPGGLGLREPPEKSAFPVALVVASAAVVALAAAVAVSKKFG